MGLDEAALDRILKEYGLGAKPEQGSWVSYLGALLRRGVGWVIEKVVGLLQGLGDAGGWIGPFVEILLLLAAAALVALAVSFVIRRLSRAQSPVAAATEAPPDAAPSYLRDAATWRAELDGRLAAGDLRGALEAVWWWLARSLAGGAADPSWTSRELLERSGRRDLAGPVRRLDELTYGAAPPEAAEIRRTAEELAAELPR